LRSCRALDVFREERKAWITTTRLASATVASAFSLIHSLPGGEKGEKRGVIVSVEFEKERMTIEVIVPIDKYNEEVRDSPSQDVDAGTSAW
jgi:hypothetical protein